MRPRKRSTIAFISIGEHKQMIEDDLKALTEAVRANTAALSKIAALMAMTRDGKNADCLIIDDPIPGLDLAPAAVAKPAVLTTPAPAPAAPAPAAPAPAAPAAPADPIPANYKEAKTLGLKMAAEGHSDVLKEFLASCGVKKLIDLPHDRYGDYYRWFKDKGLL